MGCGTSGFPKILHSEAREILEGASSSDNEKQGGAIRTVRSRSSSSNNFSVGSDKDRVMQFEGPSPSRGSSLASSISIHQHELYHHEEISDKGEDQRNYSLLFLDPSNVAKHDSVSDAESGIELMDQKASDLALQGSEVFTIKEDEAIENESFQKQPREDLELTQSDLEEEVNPSRIVEVDEAEREELPPPPILIHNEEATPKAEEKDSPSKFVFIKLEKYEPHDPHDLNMHLDDGSLILDIEPQDLRSETGSINAPEASLQTLD